MPKAKSHKRRKPTAPPYESVESLILRRSLTWAAMHRMDPDEVLSLANETYLKVANEWTGVFDFEKTLHYYLWRAFSIYRRKLLRQRRAGLLPLAATDVLVDLDSVVVESSSFSISLFTDGLTEDAAAVVRLVFDPPEPLVTTLRQQGGNRGGVTGGKNRGNDYYGYKVCLKRHLMREQGWGRRRVDESFRTVSAALA